MREKWKRQRLGNLFHPLGTNRKLPVSCHRIRFQQVDRFDHILRFGLQRCPGVGPAVPPIEQQNPLATLSADSLDDCRQPIKSAHTAVVFCKRHKVLIGERIGHRRTRRDAECLEEGLACKMGRKPFGFTHSEVDGRFPEMLRHELRVQIGDVNNRHLAERIKLKQVRLAQALLRCNLPKRSTPAAKKRGRCHGSLSKLPTGDHCQHPCVLVLS